MKNLLNTIIKDFIIFGSGDINQGEGKVFSSKEQVNNSGRFFFPACLLVLFFLNIQTITAQVHGCCKLWCRDTTICFNVPDSLVTLPVPTYSCDSSSGGTGGNPGGGQPCLYDSIWNNSPGVFPVGTTVVTWFVRSPFGGIIDSCTQNIIRNPPSVFSLCFTTSPPIVGGVINICNGTPITFNANCSIGISGLLWNFGNGYYSSNPVHTEPAWHYPPGTYYDTLTVYDDCGNPHDTAFMVVVDSSTGPDITCISVQCPGDTVTYHTSANCSTYNWAVTGGTFYPAPPPSSSDSATVIWGAGPSGTISLSVAGCTPPSTCTTPTIKTVKIVPTTLPIFGDTVVCSGSEITYCIECIPGNTHNWEMTPANAGTITGQGTCCITIKLNPTFFGTINLTINYQNVLTGQGCNLPDGCTNDPGCGGTGHLTIQVKPIFGISGPSKVCPNTISSPFNGMNLTTNSIEPLTSWKLTQSNVVIQTFATTALFNAYTWNNGPGIYQVTAFAPSGVYCNDSAFVTVEVVNMLVPGPILGPDTVCKNVTTFYNVVPNMGGVNYTWSISPPWAGTLIPPLNGSSIGVQWNAPGGTLFVTQTLASSPFCSSPPSPGKVVVTWPNFPLPVITPGAATACMKGTITYSIPPTLLSNATYTWSVVPSTAGNIMSANGTNTITIQWVDNSITPIFVKLKITRCYTDSVMLPINLFSLPAVPNLSYAPLQPCVNTTVNFSTTSPGMWNWNFGDLGTSALQNPPHVYTAAGTYNVVLYVTNAQGCSDTAKTSIKIEGKPVVPNIAGPPSACVNTYATYSFPEPLYPGASYTWLLSVAPKGIVISTSSNSMYLKWTSPGIDTVKMHVQSPCLDTIIKYPVVINSLPTPGISVPSPACEGTPLTFTGSGGGTYSWLFSGGVPSSASGSSPVVNYPSSGVFGVSLTVTSAAGCMKTITQQVTINPKPIAIITGPFQVCSFPATVTLSAVAMAGYTFAWTPSGSGPTISPTINAATTFSCVVTNAYGCTRTSNSITVDTSFCPPPDTMPGCFVNDTINFTHTPPVCLSTTFTKTGTATLTGWNFGDGGSAGPVSPISHTYPYPGIFLVTVQGSANGLDINGNPCVKPVSKSKFVTIPFNAKFTYKFQCNGANQMQVIFTNTSEYLGSAGSYQWNWYDNSNPISNLPFPGPITISPAGPHVIDLTIFDPVTLATCTVTHTINVPSPIVAAFSTSSPACQNSPVTFTDNSILLANEVSRLFTAYPAGPTATGSPDSMIYTSSGPFTASLTVTDIYGCSSTTTQSVNVLPAAVGSITVGSTNCDSVQLTASPGTGPFTWTVISPPPFPDNPVYVKTSGYYKVKGISLNGCPYTAGPVLVTVKPSPNATITGKTNYCQGEQLDIKTSSAGSSIVWNQLAPTFIAGVGVGPNLNIVPTPTGPHTYQVVITGLNGCTASATYNINVDAVPSAASIVASGPLTFCDGDSVILTVNPPGAIYLWSKSPTPPLSSPANSNDSLIVKVSGTYSVIVQTASGCAYPAIPPKTITVNPNPVANITGDTVLCEGDNLILTSTNLGGVSYAWTGPAGTQVTNPYVKPNVQLTDAGVYIVTVTDNVTGCSASDTITVIINPAPAPPVIVSNPGGVLCQGPLFNFSVVGPLGPPIVYTWNTGQMGPSINAYLVGSYYVSATNQFGCSAKSNTLKINPRPDLSCVPSGCYEFCNECTQVTIPGVPGFAFYNWEMLVGNVFTFYSATQNLTVMPPGGKFRLVAANQFGCADTSDTLSITFYDCCPPPDTISCKDTCITFNNLYLNGFQPHPSAPNVIVNLTNVGSMAGNNDYFISAQDQPGPSQLLAGPLFNGKWCCGEICYYFKLINDSLPNSVVNPSFVIRSGTAGFKFSSSVNVTLASGWQRICAPVNDCDSLPVSNLGTWTPLLGTQNNQWLSVLANVTELIFQVDYTPDSDEIIGIDEICFESNVPEIHAGADTTICAGSYATLQVEGCDSVPEWYELGGNGPVFIGAGPIIDVNPSQTTCYIVICCSASPCCCDTDTVCVFVNPLPTISWPVVYPNVCLNSSPVYLDTLSISVAPPGGTGVFSGPFVTGNYFYPNALGTFVITYCYTDTNGCTKCVYNSITVEYCCDTSQCHVDIIGDTSVCIGGVTTLTAQGCNGTVAWYQLGPGGPVLVGNGPIFDAFPQQSTCYMVICCCPDPVYNVMCCDTDTVCISVKPLPTVNWPVVFPNVCLNSAPVYLDTLNIIASPPGGTGVFSGINVSGNYFYPNALGTYVITYCYTDTNGCLKCVNNSITVEFCCDTSLCHVDAGSDTTICARDVITLYAQGCAGSVSWYMLGPGGPVAVGQGPIIDVIPGQSTCYVAICCCQFGDTVCCSSDTICVTVNPLPIVSWPVVFPNVCNNSSPVYLDTLLISVSPTGGTGFFSGLGVTGNYFYPGAPGTYTITYCYIDLNGCTTCVNNTITVDYCCDTSFCHVDIIGDTTICPGEVAILSAQGCSGSVTWYQLGPEGPILVGNGPIFDAFPQQSTCYMVICCCPDPVYNAMCCDTDTVCITVNPLPIVSWPVIFPNVCNNSSPVYLDTLAIAVSPTGGTGFFTGIGVTGNYFNPGAPGTYTITYCYVDLNGCTTCVNNTIIVDFCCDSTTCHVDIYGDTTICSGEVAILSAQGCSGSVMWYQLGPEGPILVGNGPIFDAFPQQSSCYMVICCCPDPIYNVLCCDTDTVCITVNPLPVVTWNYTFPNVCHNGGPVYLDTLNIVATPPGGTGSFSGIGVSGYYFTPPGPGTFTIMYCYTDTNGCIKCINKSITVDFCCDTSMCHVDAGPDTTICSGEVFILTAQGCNGNAVWYALTAEGPILVGNGPIFDAFPQQSTCYMVICCCPDPVYNVLCCDTDTVCITVKPTPILTWPLSYADVCLNGPPVFLDPNNILVLINNVWTPVTSAPGTGYFSGPGVLGSSFYPMVLGLNTITYFYTDTNGCTGSITNTINVIDCSCNPVTCNCNMQPPPPGPTITINSIDPDDCHQTGCIHATFTGCCLMFSYSYFDPCRPELSYSIPQTADSTIFCNLRAGTYIIYVQDACGNFAQQTVVVPLLNGPLTSSVSYSTCGGSVCVTPQGGCPPYTYNWLNGDSTQCSSGYEPCMETYVEITDSRGCSITQFVLIPGIRFTNVVQPTCCLANGRLCVSACFGPHPYQYQWSGPSGPLGGNSPCIANLLPGTYCLTITNALGQSIQCCYTLTSATISAPPVSFIYSNCGSSVTAIIGQSDCEGYTYYWDDNSGDLVRDNIEGCDSLTFTIETCDGNIYHHGFKVPHVFPSLVPVNCATGIGAICIDVQCFRCPPYTYTWTPVGGSSVVGNSCYYTVPGLYNVCITNSCGDVICCRVYLPPPICDVTVDVHVIIEGYYTGSGLMNNYGSGGCLYVNGISTDSSDADTIFVSAMDTLFPYAEVERKSGILKTDGSVSVTFGPAVVPGNSYYLVINHRNALETWSANPVVVNSVTNYDFTSAQSQAYGNNMIETFDNMGWAIFSGDISDVNYLGLGVGYQDDVVDGQDYGDMETAVYYIYSGYVAEDITGDGVVDGSDYSLMETNVYFIRATIRP